MSFSSSASSRSNSDSGSPDLELDPADPLNLLLHSQSSDSSMDDSSAGASPPDWSQLSALWSSPFEDPNLSGDGNTKDFTDMMDFSMPLGSDLDFGSQMAIDPHALHFDTQKFGLDDFSLSPSQNFSFSFQPDVNPSQGRRLSVTSSSSSSGASLSPVVGSSPAPSQHSAVDSTSSASLDSAAEELAQRVRQSAGIIQAIPIGMQQNNGKYTLSFNARFLNILQLLLPTLPCSSPKILGWGQRRLTFSLLPRSHSYPRLRPLPRLHPLLPLQHPLPSISTLTLASTLPVLMYKLISVLEEWV